MRKMIVWILALAMLAGARTAAAESRQPPDIPDFRDTRTVRPVRTEEEAIAYAKEIWALDYLGMDFPIACYEADRYEENSWVVYAKDGTASGTLSSKRTEALSAWKTRAPASSRS